jgi:hypothetical protein
MSARLQSGLITTASSQSLCFFVTPHSCGRASFAKPRGDKQCGTARLWIMLIAQLQIKYKLGAARISDVPAVARSAKAEATSGFRYAALRMLGRSMHKWNDQDLIVLTGRTFESATVTTRAIGLYAGKSHSGVALRAVRAANQEYRRRLLRLLHDTPTQTDSI